MTGADEGGGGARVLPRTVWEPAAWAASHPNCHAIFKVSGITILSVMFDMMHSKHLGVDTYFLGSVLWLLCHRLLDGTPAENLARVMGRARDFWEEHRVEGVFRKIKLSMFCPEKEDQFPRLKGKATEVRHLIAPLVSIWQNCMDPHDEGHRMVLLALRASWRIEQILTDNVQRTVFPPGVAKEYEECMFAYMATFNACARHYNSHAEYVFDITQKCHFMQHIRIDGAHLNPRKGWCYANESYMNIVRRLGSSCCKGNKAWQVTSKFGRKYRRAMHMVMSKFGKSRSR